MASTTDPDGAFSIECLGLNADAHAFWPEMVHSDAGCVANRV